MSKYYINANIIQIDKIEYLTTIYTYTLSNIKQLFDHVGVVLLPDMQVKQDRSMQHVPTHLILKGDKNTQHAWCISCDDNNIPSGSIIVRIYLFNNNKWEKLDVANLRVLRENVNNIKYDSSGMIVSTNTYAQDYDPYMYDPNM